MKKLIFITILIFSFCIGSTVYAQDEVVKISMDDTVKRAKEFGSGNGIEFTLPDIDNNKFLIDTIELAIFEKTASSNNWTIYKNSSGFESKKQLIQNPTSLNFQVDFGDVADMRENAKYKIGYRYYVKPIDDFSKIVIAGQDIKDGWRLVGEANSSTASDTGFMYYKNAVPTINLNNISYNAETISGEQSFSCSANEVESILLPSDVLAKGITVDYTVNDYDNEDSLTVGYKLIDVIKNMIVAEGVLPSTNCITSDCEAAYVKLVLTVSDNWGAFAESPSLTLMIDKDMPEVVSEFNDLDRVIRGKNLYSKFTITDDQNVALTNGSVYYTIRKDGVTLYSNVAMPNNLNGEYTVNITGMTDGVYDIELTIFDKAHNRTVHTLSQTLDNTPPKVSFLAPTQNANATLYSTWMNESKKIIFTATDEIAGVKKCNGYCNYNSFVTTSLGNAQSIYTFNYSVSTTKSGKLYYYFYIYDNAVTINKTTNSVNASASGNSCFVSKYVWLDKTPPTVTINADENEWYGSPKVITADFYDYQSSASVADNSGVKSKLYCITENNVLSDDWLTYPTNGITFNTGGVYYLHIKAIDYAGNETLQTRKIKINTPLEITSNVEPTDDYWHTIYNHTNSLYVVKNTAYNTKYQFTISEQDISDLIRTEVNLVSKDNSEIYSSLSVDTASDGTVVRDVVFNMSYTKSDGTALPDGVYTMYLTVSEIKNDGTVLTNHQNVIGCEVVIKRNSPPTPEITVSSITGGKQVTISYPDEILANSLNSTYIKSLYKREYKIVYDGEANTNRYSNYTAAISAITKPCLVTAIYTDPAGNVATATKRIDVSDIPDSSSITVKQDGNTVTIEEGRPATIYYINTRRDKESGINIDVFDFMN